MEEVLSSWFIVNNNTCTLGFFKSAGGVTWQQSCRVKNSSSHCGGRLVDARHRHGGGHGAGHQVPVHPHSTKQHAAATHPDPHSTKKSSTLPPFPAPPMPPPPPPTPSSPPSPPYLLCHRLALHLDGRAGGVRLLGRKRFKCSEGVRNG